MTVKQLLTDSSDQLIDAGYVHGLQEAEIILSDLMQIDSAKLLSDEDNAVDQSIVEAFNSAIKKRLKGMPVAYILGYQPFMGRKFLSDKRALIPRSETEQLSELLIHEIPKKQIEKGKFLEIGTGSGIIAVTLADYFPDASITATDISEEALELAEDNAQRLGADIKFIHSDLFQSVPKEKFDLIVANLPYVPTGKLAFTSDQILDYEPMIAIDAGEDGLKYIKLFLATIKPYLNKKSLIALEMWHTHGEEIKKLTKKYLPGHDVTIEKDLANHDRFAFIS